MLDPSSIVDGTVALGSPPVSDLVYPRVWICTDCARRVCTSLGIPIRDGVQLIIDSQQLPSSGAPTCAACLGVSQHLDDLVVPKVVSEIRESPFLDAEEIAISFTWPRGITFVWLAAVLCAARKIHSRTSADCELHRKTALAPTAVASDNVVAFRDALSADLRARVMQSLTQQRCDDNDGNDHHVKSLKLVLNVCLTEVDGLSAEVTLAHPWSTRIENALPANYRSNKCELPVPWQLVEQCAVPTVLSGCAANDLHPASVSVRVSNSTVFIAGRYRKEVRNISQSPWFVKGERQGMFSLQELIANPILSFFFPNGIPVSGSDAPQEAADDEPVSKAARTSFAASMSPFAFSLTAVLGLQHYRFHSSGREDVDVRMLGDGRPFVLEVIAPHRSKFTSTDVAAMEEAVNRCSGDLGAAVSGLSIAGRDAVPLLGVASQTKRKTYRCVVWCSRPLTRRDPLLTQLERLTDLEITQQTPLRVMHRRTIMSRKRVIHSIAAALINAHWLVVDLETQAGTYVKEFCHGDLGRTVPSLSLLLNATTDIIQLDVVGIVCGAATDATAQQSDDE